MRANLCEPSWRNRSKEIRAKNVFASSKGLHQADETVNDYIGDFDYYISLIAMSCKSCRLSVQHYGIITVPTFRAELASPLANSSGDAMLPGFQSQSKSCDRK